MKHDESALVKQALRDAREQLARRGHVLPAAYMLVTNNPQTGAPLTHPTALASQREQPFGSQAEFDDFVNMLRAEAARLAAVAVAVGGEAQAEIETAGASAFRRVWVLRVEDLQGIEQLHALIEPDDRGGLQLGQLQADAGAADMIGQPLLAPAT